MSPNVGGSDTSCSESVERNGMQQPLPVAEVDISLQSDFCDDKTAATTISSNSESSSYFACHKNLRFSDEEAFVIDYLPRRTEIEPEQRKALWWSPQDYEVFAETARSISQEVRKHQTLTCGLDDAYRQAEKLLQHQQHDDKQDHQHPSQEFLHQISVDSLSCQGLAHWCAHGHSRRGLERAGSILHSYRRGERSMAMKRDLLALQSLSSSSSQTTKSSMADELRQVSEQYSLLPKLFARMMGEADFAAATKAHQQNSFMRRWSDVGSSSSSSSMTTLEEQAAPPLMRRIRTGSLPHDMWSGQS